MDERLTPVKTAQGHDELGTRQRRLGPRHRTMLVLVDGVRTIQEVLQLSAQAGAPAPCFDELISMGLVVVPDAVPFRPMPSQELPGPASAASEGSPELEAPITPTTSEWVSDKEAPPHPNELLSDGNSDPVSS